MSAAVKQPAPTPAAGDWKSRVATKRTARDALLPKNAILSNAPDASVLDVSGVPRASGLLTPLEIEITETPTVADLLAALRDKKYTSEQVVTAFCRRATIAQQVTNCLGEVFFDQAIAHARELDAEYAKTGKVRGPLHGLPVSLKEQIGVKGVERSFAMVGFLGRVPEKDSALVEILVKQGAVPFCTTNVAQGLYYGETINNVFGETCNPYNRRLTCGGSSGGEGALIAMRGSVLGVGSDIGGSVRIPAGFCGIYSLRPSYQRIPYEGTCNSQEGQDSIRSVLGPMSASLDGIKTLFKAVLDAKPWTLDPQCLRMPWSEERYHLAEHGGEGGKLCFAIMWDDKHVRPVPPNRRAMEETAAALKAAGHEVIDWEAHDHEDGNDIFLSSFFGDGFKDLFDTMALSGEPRVGPLAGQPQGKELSVSEWWALHYRKGKWLKALLDKWMATSARTGTGRPVDAVLSPIAGNAPQLLQKLQYHFYTSWCNVADLPSVVVPVTRVDPKRDTKPSRDQFYGELDKYTWEQYDPAVYANAPIGLQVIGQKDEDEAVLRMAEIVDEALRSRRTTSA